MNHRAKAAEIETWNQESDAAWARMKDLEARGLAIAQNGHYPPAELCEQLDAAVRSFQDVLRRMPRLPTR
jgi:hypothetical protein